MQNLGWRKNSRRCQSIGSIDLRQRASFLRNFLAVSSKVPCSSSLFTPLASLNLFCFFFVVLYIAVLSLHIHTCATWWRTERCTRITDARASSIVEIFIYFFLILSRRSRLFCKVRSKVQSNSGRQSGGIYCVKLGEFHKPPERTFVSLNENPLRNNN